MTKEKTPIENALDVTQIEAVGFGYGQLKRAAKIAAEQHGIDWARKAPLSREGFYLRVQLRQTVLSCIHRGHSNRDVVWQRFCKYALSFNTTQVGEQGLR